jgi:GntR family transcriptional regulator
MNTLDVKKLRPNAQDPTPKYLQIARKMTHLIEQSDVLAHHGLPSERQLVELLEISRVTARKALQVMTESGLVIRKPGSGTFVAPRLEQPLSRLSSFSEELRLRGLNSTATWLVRDLALANSQELMALGLAHGSRVTRLKRLRLADNSPMAVEYCRLPEAMLPDPSVLGSSLYEYLDAADRPVIRALQTFSAISANEEHAKLLEVKIGDALIFVTRVGYGRDGKAMELTESYCRPGVYEFVAELKRNPASLAVSGS